MIVNFVCLQMVHTANGSARGPNGKPLTIWSLLCEPNSERLLSKVHATNSNIHLTSFVYIFFTYKKTYFIIS